MGGKVLVGFHHVGFSPNVDDQHFYDTVEDAVSAAAGLARELGMEFDADAFLRALEVSGYAEASGYALALYAEANIFAEVVPEHELASYAAYQEQYW